MPKLAPVSQGLSLVTTATRSFLCGVGSLFNDAFSVRRLYSVDDKMTSE